MAKSKKSTIVAGVGTAGGRGAATAVGGAISAVTAEAGAFKEYGGRKVAAARADIKKRFPHGVGADVLTTQVHNELRVLCEGEGRTPHSYENVRRALKRRKR